MNRILTPANLLTTFRIVLVPVYLWLFALQTRSSIVLALVIFVTAALTDLYDGHLARSRREITRLGKFLDPLADKFLVIGALAQFGLLGLVNIWLVAVIVIRDVWVTALRVIAIKNGTELKTSGNAKLKTAIQLTVVITIIVFTGVRVIALHTGYSGPFVNFTIYRIVFDILVLIAVLFTLYSWFAYQFGKKTVKA